LAPNARNGKPLGFVCDWVFVKWQRPGNSIFGKYFTADEIIPIPINHAEGKFVLSKEAVSHFNELGALHYCAVDGSSGDYPINPNGSTKAIAGISNKEGNVLAMMPHPERAVDIKQIPFWIEGKWSEKKKSSFKADDHQNIEGPWQKLFKGLRDYLETR